MSPMRPRLRRDRVVGIVEGVVVRAAAAIVVIDDRIVCGLE